MTHYRLRNIVHHFMRNNFNEFTQNEETTLIKLEFDQSKFELQNDD